MSAGSTSALFERVGDNAVEPSPLARGPWDPGLLHGGAVGALAAHTLQDAIDADYQPVRLTVDLVRPVPLRRLTTTVEVVRAGARLGSARATIGCDGKVVAVATLLALRPSPLEPAADNDPTPPPDRPDDGDDRWGLPEDADAFLGGAMSFRFVTPNDAPPAMWVSLHCDVFPGVAPSPLARAAAAADVPSAITTFDGVRYDGVGFINADLSLHLHRLPEGPWVRVSGVSRWEPSGIGTVSAVLADGHGSVGRVSQGLILAAGLTPPPPV